MEKRVGQGSFGEVYAGYMDKQKIALKKIKPSKDTSVPASFLKELLIQQSVFSEHVVEFKGVLHCNQEGVFPFVIMTEFVECDLYKAMRSMRL